ncbi:hypothetical protein [Aquimarina sp. Aq107]|uniref:hypothetical protein n=1 Tax=Aquimarina sp. Aq107 TaxID=1191912 RepID=UPI000D54E488|nr:hypothetical protein [Aquimarina sp. Aq107]
MKKDFEKKLKSKRTILKGIGILEIIGGITGIGLIMWLILKGIETNIYLYLILLLAFGFYFYSIFAGIKIFRNLEQGTFHSIVLQLIQLIAISYGGVTYLLTSAGYLFIGYNITGNDLKLETYLGSRFQINIINSDQDSFVFINIVALVILIIIDTSKKSIKEQAKLKESYDANMREFEKKANC